MLLERSLQSFIDIALCRITFLDARAMWRDRAQRKFDEIVKADQSATSINSAPEVPVCYALYELVGYLSAFVCSAFYGVADAGKGGL